jgi:hypothetical protein
MRCVRGAREIRAMRLSYYLSCSLSASGVCLLLLLFAICGLWSSNRRPRPKPKTKNEEEEEEEEGFLSSWRLSRMLWKAEID